MIFAKITMTDGDEINMVFESWPALALWMQDHIGAYISVDAKPVTIKAGG